MNGTPWTHRHLATLSTGNHAAGAPAVEKQNGLLSPLQIGRQLSLKLRTDAAAVAGPEFLLHVGDIDGGKGPFIISFAQCYQMIDATLGQIHTLY